MKMVRSAKVIEGQGLEGDKHAGGAPDRQILLADKESLDAVNVRPGMIKENLTVEGLNVMELPPGSRLHLGASAVLEITKVCEPCFRMDEIRDGLQQELIGRRGMVSRVVQGGSIHVGDPIAVEEAQPLAS
jgi:MOSC domain-containing protein YiiM